MENSIFEEKSCDKNSVWFYFLREKKGQMGKCKQCKNIIKTQGGSTSGLRTHLKSVHKINVSKRNSTGSDVYDTEIILRSSSCRGQITNYFTVTDIETLPAILARMTARDGLAFNIISTSTDVRKGIIARGFPKIPTSGNSIRKIVMDYSKEIRKQMTKDFSSRIMQGQRFSLTFDEWTSIKNRRYLNINVHTSCKRFWNLGLARVHGSLPAEKCVELVEKKLTENGLSLDTNIVSITTDGASVMTKVGRLVKANQQLCIVHGIQLAIIKVLYNRQEIQTQDREVLDSLSDLEDCDEDLTNEDEHQDEEFYYENGLTIIDSESEVNNHNSYLITHRHRAIAPLIDKIRKVVKLFRRSPTKNDKTLQKYVKEEFGKELSLILDAKTRWNSLLLMLERFFQLKQCIEKALIDLNLNAEFRITEDEFSLVSTIISALLPVKLTVEACCRQDSSLLSANAAVRFMFKELANQNNALSKELKEELEVRMCERQTELTSVLRYLHNPNSADQDEETNDEEMFNNKISKSTTIKIIVNLLERLYFDKNLQQKQTESSEIENIDIPFPSTVPAAEHEPQLALKEKLEMAISNQVNQNKIEASISKQKNTKDLQKVIRQEITYFEAENIRGKYLQLAYDCLLSIPPTSVESERAFSAAGIICTKIRSRLNDKTLDELSFLRSYFNQIQK